MVGKDRHLVQNTCKGRARASKQAVEGPGLNEVVMEVETLSSGVYFVWQPDYLVSLPSWDFCFVAGCCGGKDYMKPPCLAVAGQWTKIHRGRFLGWHGQAEKALWATYPRVSFTKGFCSQSLSPGTVFWPREAAMLLTGAGAFCIQDVTAVPSLHFLWHPHTTQSWGDETTCAPGASDSSVFLLLWDLLQPCADASSCLPTPWKLMPLPLSQEPCTCWASLPDSFRSA